MPAAGRPGGKPAKCGRLDVRSGRMSGSTWPLRTPGAAECPVQPGPSQRRRSAERGKEQR